MRTLLLVGVALASVALVAGCGVMAMAPVVAPITIDLKGPVQVADNQVKATKTGVSEAMGVILVAVGDASIQKAAQNGGITRIHHVDSETLNVLGIYARYRTVVYGE